jgi:hypothetical protein
MSLVKIQGERWFPSENTFSSELPSLWGNWYCDSEIGKLRAVLLRKAQAPWSATYGLEHTD